MLRVVSIPAGHPYVERITALPSIELLPDPRPEGAPPGQWWPPVAMDPAWIRDHAGAADILHIHFGTESFTTAHLLACLEAAREVGWPVVFTVHDIEHPQLDDQAGYLAQLDALVPRVDALVTLTPGAAAEIMSRWNRTAVVSPHPALLPADAPVPRAIPSADVQIGMHLKDLRSNIDAVGMTRCLGAALDHLSEAGISAHAEVRMHHKVRNTDVRDEVRSLSRGFDRMTLVEHERLDDPGLWSSLAQLDVCVLPYDHGTHSGWLELCWDLAVAVVVPATGFYAEQHTDGSVVSLAERTDGDSLATAIVAAIGAPVATRAGSLQRGQEVERRRSVRKKCDEKTAAVHASLYQQLLGKAGS